MRGIVYLLQVKSFTPIKYTDIKCVRARNTPTEYCKRGVLKQVGI